MTLQIELTPAQERRLKDGARELGLDIPEYVQNIIDQYEPQRKARVLTGYGKFAHIGVNSEDVHKDRQEEIARDEAAFLERSRGV